jgi:hypothetical protein
MRKITKKEWEETPKDYKSIIDGVKHKLYLDDKLGTVLTPVEVEG